MKAINAIGEHEKYDFEFEAFGIDGMNGLGQQLLNEVAGGFNKPAMITPMATRR